MEPGEQGEGRPSGARPQPTSRWVWGAVIAVLLWAIVLIAIFASRTLTLAEGIFGAVGVVAALAAIFIPHLNLPRLAVATTKRAVVAGLLICALISVVWIGAKMWQANRAIDVRSHVAPSGNRDVREGGHPAAIGLVLPEPREVLELVLHIDDHNPEAGSCAKFIDRLVVTAQAGKGVSEPIVAAPDTPTRIEIPPGSKEINLKIWVDHVRNDVNCGVDIDVAEAALKNELIGGGR